MRRFAKGLFFFLLLLLSASIRPPLPPPSFIASLMASISVSCLDAEGNISIDTFVTVTAEDGFLFAKVSYTLNKKGLHGPINFE